MRKSILTHMTILIGIPVLGVVSLVLLVSYWGFRDHFEKEERDELEASIRILKRSLDNGVLEKGDFSEISSHHSVVFGLYSQSGQPLEVFYGWNAERILEKIEATPWPYTIEVDGQHYVGKQIKTIVKEHNQPVWLRVAMNVHTRQEFMSYLYRWLAIAIIVIAVLLPLFVYVGVRHGMRALNELSQSVGQVTAENLAIRWLPERFPLEIQPFIVAMNQMLERLERGYETLDQLANDMAHELKTPLTSQMTSLQVTLSRPRTAEEYQNTLFEVLKECEYISRIINDMLMIARVRTLPVSTHELVDINVLIERQISLMSSLAQHYKMSFRVHIDPEAKRVRGSVALLERALNNLISNAIKYGRSDSIIFIGSYLHTPGKIRIEVRNSGDAPEDFKEKAFLRFWTAGVARTRTSEGQSGLGLAIVESVVEAHGGRVGVHTVPGQVTVWMELPKCG